MAGFTFKITNNSLAHVKAIKLSVVKQNEKFLAGKIATTNSKPDIMLSEILSKLKIDPGKVRISTSLSIHLRSDPTLLFELEKATQTGRPADQVLEEVFGKAGITIFHEEEQDIIYLLKEHSAKTASAPVKTKEKGPIVERRPKIEIKPPVLSAQGKNPEEKAPTIKENSSKTEAHLKAIQIMKGPIQARAKSEEEAFIGETTFNILINSNIKNSNQLMISKLLEKISEPGGESKLLALDLSTFLERKPGERDEALIARAKDILNDLTELQKIVAKRPDLTKDDKNIRLLMMQLQLKLKK